MKRHLKYNFKQPINVFKIILKVVFKSISC